MLSPSLISDLMNSPMQTGKLEWIGVRPTRRARMHPQSSAHLIEGLGIEGDHYKTKNRGARQVTLIGIEDLKAIASFLGLKEIEAYWCTPNNYNSIDPTEDDFYKLLRF